VLQVCPHKVSQSLLSHPISVISIFFATVNFHLDKNKGLFTVSSQEPNKKLSGFWFLRIGL